MNRDVARVLEQIKSCLRYGGGRFLYALNTERESENERFFLLTRVKEAESEIERE